MNLEEGYAQQKGLCYWCKQPMGFKHWGTYQPYQVTREHLIDRIDTKGARRPQTNNIVLAHHRCNQMRNYIKNALIQEDFERAFQLLNSLFDETWKEAVKKQPFITRFAQSQGM